MARQFWPHEDPIGKRIDAQIGDVNNNAEIVGVVGDVRIDTLDTTPGYQTYLPYRQLASSQMTLVIRTLSDPEQIAAAARRQVMAVDPQEPVSNVKTMRKVIDDSVASRRMSAAVVAAFAFFALALAVIGIYGVVSYWVTQRIREIGIRSALGAQRRDIFELVIGRGALLAACGLAVGIAVSFAANRYMAALLFGVTTHDWTILVAVPIILGTVALFACVFPALRASRVDPLVALRFE